MLHRYNEAGGITSLRETPAALDDTRTSETIPGVTAAAKNAICILLALQVGLVGVLGTGLHSLFGCSHGIRLADGTHAAAGCCTDEACCCECDDASPFERYREAQRAAIARAVARGEQVISDGSDSKGCSGDCSICDLLEQYHSATGSESKPRFFLAEINQRHVAVDNVDANVSARLADSRGPPAVSLS